MVQVPNFKYLCLRARSLPLRSLMQQDETVISALTDFYQLTERPLHRYIKTYIEPEIDQSKNVDVATEKS